MEVDEGLMVAAHRRTGRQHPRITVEAEAAGVEAGLVADTLEAEEVDTLAAAVVGTQVVADTPVVVAKKLMVDENAAQVRAAFFVSLAA